jgi:RimJ/RimL family protein N-acetyltransferase
LERSAQGLTGVSRIALLPWSDDDLWAVERFLTDPEMMRHLGGPQSREQALEQHKRFLEAGRSGTDQMFKVVLSAASDVIGNIGYWDRTWREELIYETGWMIFPEHQGRGYASEALAVLVAMLRCEHSDRSLHAFPAVTNGPSNGLCRKLGFTNLGEHEFEYPAGHPLQCNDWRLDLSLAADRPDALPTDPDVPSTNP